MSTTITTKIDSFQKGMRHLAVKDVAETRAEIMEFLGVTSDPAWLRWVRGENEFSRTKAKGLEQIFAKRKVSKRNVWGE